MAEHTVIDNNTLNALFSELAQLKQPFTVKVVKKRSLPANALFHVWCAELAPYLTQNAPRLGLLDENGVGYSYSPESIKIIAKEAHGVTVTTKNPITGSIRQYLKSTADYDDSEMYALMQGLKSTSLHVWGYHLVSKGQYLEWCEQQM